MSGTPQKKVTNRAQVKTTSRKACWDKKVISAVPGYGAVPVDATISSRHSARHLARPARDVMLPGSERLSSGFTHTKQRIGVIYIRGDTIDAIPAGEN